MKENYSISRQFYRDVYRPSVDRVRSQPVYYVYKHETIDFDDNVWRLIYRNNLHPYAVPGNRLNRPLWEFNQAGYVLGERTLIDGLYQMTAGQWLMNGSIRNWYEYKPTNGPNKSIDSLGDTLLRVFRRTAEDAAGDLIVVALSGGLDSRLVLAGLHSVGYRNLAAFSYGPPGNDEARIAEKVCRALKVPWTFIPRTHESVREYYSSVEGKGYLSETWDYATAPNLQDVDIVSKLHLPFGSIIINGQAMDFLSGGHIPAADDLSRYIADKHFSLRRRDRDPEIACTTWQEYETWEWRERQSKYVIGGQRAYEYYGYRWDLPLWHNDLMDFFVDVPLDQKVGQKLYKDFLADWNYMGVFGKCRAVRRHGTKTTILARSLYPFRNIVYQWLRWYGYYGPMWGPFGAWRYIRHGYSKRHALAFFIEDLLEAYG